MAPAAHAQQGPVVPRDTRLSVRLADSVEGTTAAKGRRIRAALIAPVALDNRVALASGDTVLGVIAASGVDGGVARKHYVTLTFDSIVITSAAGASTRMALGGSARVVDVPDARESVEPSGRIAGPPHPRFYRSRADWVGMLLGATDPLVGVILLGAFNAEEAERHRRIAYAPGVELTLALSRSLTLPDWPRVPVIPEASAAAVRAVQATPLRAVTESGHLPADPLLVALIGTRDDVTAAFTAAGWTAPERMSLRADLATLEAAARAQGYAAQPFSTLLVNDRPPDLAFEKVVNSMAKRNHLRIWNTGTQVDGRPLWLLAATRDIGVMISKARRTFTHRVDPNLDAERQKVVNDLLSTGAVRAMSWMTRTAPADPILVNDGTTPATTDWRTAIIVLR